MEFDPLYIIKKVRNKGTKKNGIARKKGNENGIARKIGMKMV